MPEEFSFMPHVRERFPRWMKCHACQKPLHDHTEEEFRECHGPAQPPHLYEWIERKVRPNPNKNPGGALIGNMYIRPADPNAEDAWKKVAENKDLCARIALEECEVCHRKFGEHSEDECAACLKVIARRTEEWRLAENARQSALRARRSDATSQE